MQQQQQQRQSQRREGAAARAEPPLPHRYYRQKVQPARRLAAQRLTVRQRQEQGQGQGQELACVATE